VPGGRQEVYHDIVADDDGRGSVNWVLQNPGRYEWDLRGPKGEELAAKPKPKMSFVVKPDFEAIETLDPLVGGVAAGTNKLQGKQRTDFDIAFRWKPYADATQFRIAVSRSPKMDPVLIERTVNAPQFSFNKDKIFNGRIYYRISAPLK